MNFRILLHRSAAILLFAGAAGCGNTRADVQIVGLETGVTREQYLKLPGSARLTPEADASSSARTGVAVEVVVKIDSLKGELVPLRYALRQPGAKHPSIAGKVTFEPDRPAWHTRGHVWIPVAAPGTYYVEMEMDHPRGYKGEPRRTKEFTIE